MPKKAHKKISKKAPRRIVAEQPILVYCGHTQMIEEAIKRGGCHPIVELTNKYGPKWAKQQDILPAIIKLRVVVKEDVIVSESHIKTVRDEIARIVKSLPKPYQSFYEVIIGNLDNKDEKMDVPRLIEYLTMVSVRYILDCIRRDREDIPAISLSGLTFTARKKGDRFNTQVWIFHNYSQQDIDALFDECVKLSAKMLKIILSGKGQINLLKILDIKCHSDEYALPLSEDQINSRSRRQCGIGYIVRMIKSFHLLVCNRFLI